ncbi:MAG: ribosome recycling factor [Candidatus Buchananbacteria bacterium]|nr:ribosome recycling factor [Candidatus Buchananbacteria bacterium]
MEPLLDIHKKELDKSLENLNNDLATMRVGRANPMIVENILIEAYGAKTPLKQLASISVPEARTILIQPWDKTISKDIEKGIVLANIGINPVNEGAQIRLSVPPLTEESRKELVKAVGEKMEKAKIAIRQIRDKVRDDIAKQEKNKEITEDDKYALQKKLDDLVKEYNEKIKLVGEKKEKEIMTI